MSTPIPSPADVEKAYERCRKYAEAGGYRLNRDADFVRSLMGGMLVNQQRYGYQSCPCRLASGKQEDDLDIVCPCDYRDRDIGEFGACFCALYVSQEVLDGKRELSSIPDRRPPRSQRGKTAAAPAAGGGALKVPLPVWRCKVCGYLCARDGPPEICPICKAGKDRLRGSCSLPLKLCPPCYQACLKVFLTLGSMTKIRIRALSMKSMAMSDH